MSDLTALCIELRAKILAPTFPADDTNGGGSFVDNGTLRRWLVAVEAFGSNSEDSRHSPSQTSEQV